MPVITIAIHKGGTGKTTCALHQVFDLDRRGKSVCLIDCDSQGNASSAFTKHEPHLPGAGSLFLEDFDPAIIRKSEAGEGNISVIQADDSLITAQALPGSPALVFRANVRALLERFDYIVIDTPPTLGFLVTAPLIASDYFYSPIVPDSYSAKGVTGLFRKFHEVRDEHNPGLRFLGLVVNQYEHKNRMHREVTEWLKKKVGKFLIPCTVHRRSPLSYVTMTGKPVWTNKDGSARVSRKEVEGLMDWIYARVGGVQA